LIDSVQAKAGRDRVPETFRLGVRLLVESGLPNIADQTAWTESLVGAYVDAECVATTIAYAGRARGAMRERTLVAVTLFKRWIQVLQPGASAIAGAMLQFLAASAKDFDWSFFSDRNLSGAGFEALKEIARTRPEFRTLAVEPVVSAVIAKLADRNFVAVSTAIEIADAYLDVLANQALGAVVIATVDALGRFDPGKAPWPVVRPAMALLSSAQVMSLCERDTALRTRVTSTLLQFSLESETESPRLMYLLRNLNPAWIEGQVDASRLDIVVSELRRRAGEINSSAAVGNIMALLVAPALAGGEGVRDAINGVLSILQSAANGRPSISFSEAYRPLMLLTERAEEFVRELSIPQAEFTTMIEPLFEVLLQVWRKAPEVPLIFAGFAFPRPSAPNPTLVHNWTFASIGFARSLGREQEMTAAVEAAAHHPLLETPMAVARLFRVTAGDLETFNIEPIQGENREAFYAALGQRLVQLRALPMNRRTNITTVLLEQCFRLGPKGLDAGVFAAALEIGIQSELLSPEAMAYRRRLDNDPELRLSLAPLFESLKRSEGVEP
jgi:hypothetical protein